MPENSSVLASIIIVNFNGEKFLEKCLESIFKQTKLPYEVIVVDSGSSDNSLKLLKSKFGTKKLLTTIPFKENIGPAYGRNAGAQKSRGRYLVFLDCDTRVGDDWLSKPIAHLEKHPETGAGQLKILKMGTANIYDCAGEKLTAFGFLSERARGARDVGQFDKVENIFSGKTAAMVVKREVFNQVGGFDHDLFMYWEEPDFCWRVWKAGYRVVFLPMGQIWHAFGTEDKEVSKEHAVWITHQGCRNQLITIIKNAAGLDFAKMMLVVTATWLILLGSFLIKCDLRRGTAVAKAFIWLISHPTTLVRKRRRLKEKLGSRFYQDRAWMPKITAERDIKWYVGKGRAYIAGKPF